MDALVPQTKTQPKLLQTKLETTATPGKAKSSLKMVNILDGTITAKESKSTMTTMTTIVDLHLNKKDQDADDADDDDSITSSTSSEDHPRRLLRMPVTGELLCWGGDTGAIRVLDTATPSSTDSSSAKIIRHWDEDDDIRAVAVSPDGTRIALGFDSGSTVIYTYSEQELLAQVVEAVVDDNQQQQQQQHPFCARRPSPKHCAAGPTFSAAIRDLAFHPAAPHLLAVATEEGLCVLDISLLQNNNKRYLQDEAAQHHDGSGIRGLAFSASGRTLASLGMDGRLCTWDTTIDTAATAATAIGQQPAHWKLRHREQGRCVTKKDVGELLGADAWDRSCRPHFVADDSLDNATTRAILAVPGETYLQLRSVVVEATGTTTKKAGQQTTFDQALEAGHVESIVAMASSSSNKNSKSCKHLISTGRDKRVILWSITQEVRHNMCRHARMGEYRKGVAPILSAHARR